jgi:hypothetical protein
MTGGRALSGALLSLACQFAASMTLGVVGAVFHLGVVSLLWSIPQWCFVIPLFRDLKRRQQERTARALLITSYLGVAINAGFIWLAVQAINHLDY